MSLKAQVISSVKWSGISTGVVTAIQFITLTILARLLSPLDFGLMGMIMVVIGFAQAFVDMGISKAIIHYQDVTTNELSSLYWLNILAGIIVFLIVCASTPLVVTFYREPRLSNLIYLSALSFLIVPFGQQFQILLQKEFAFKHLAKIEITASSANAMVAIILAFRGMGVFSLIWGQLAGALLRVLFLCYWGMGHWKPCWHFYSQDLKRYISFGLYQMGERTVNYFNSNLDYILIGSLLGAKSLGYYTLAYNLVLKPSSIINPILTRVAFPIFAKVQKDAGRLKRGYLKVLQLLSLINFPIMAGLAVVAPVAVPLIFGKQWLPSIILIQILTIVGLLCSTGNPIGALLLAKGRADLGFKWNIALTITQIPGLYLGARLGGMVGVAIAYAILMSIYSVFEYFILIRTLLGPCLREYIRNIWPSLWMSVLMAVIVLCIQLFSRGLLPYYSLIIQVLCGVAIYVGLITYRQKILVFEIKELALGKKIA